MMNPEDIQNVICQLCGHPTPEDELMFSDWDYAMCGQCYTGNNESKLSRKERLIGSELKQE